VGPAAPVVESVTAAFLKAAAAGTPTLAGLTPAVTSPSIAVLYGPAKPPVLTALPTPTPAERIAACAIPSSSG